MQHHPRPTELLKLSAIAQTPEGCFPPTLGGAKGPPGPGRGARGNPGERRRSPPLPASLLRHPFSRAAASAQLTVGTGQPASPSPSTGLGSLEGGAKRSPRAARSRRRRAPHGLGCPEQRPSARPAAEARGSGRWEAVPRCPPPPRRLSAGPGARRPVRHGAQPRAAHPPAGHARSAAGPPRALRPPPSERPQRAAFAAWAGWRAR